MIASLLDKDHIVLVLGGFATFVGLILLAGLLAGQFRRGVVQELRESLATANTEITIERGRSDRLEAEAEKLRLEVEKLRIEVTALRMVRVDDRELGERVARILASETRRQTGEILKAISALRTYVERD
jgi:hypothetical protein